MKKEHPRWGPNISRYVDTFEDQIHLAYDNYVHSREITSEVYEGLAPLQVLESTLAVCENMHKEGFQRGENSIPVIMKAIRRYTELHEHGMFSYYYGFLCVRHLMRMVCIGTLLQASVLEDFLDDLDPREDSIDVTHKLAERALEEMHDNLITRDFMKIIESLGVLSSDKPVAFPTLGGLSYDDVDFLVPTLWKDRRAIITIGNRGLLPGLGVLLFVLCEMTTVSPNMDYDNWSKMQELMLRYYLVAPNSERAILRQLTRFIDQTLLSLDKDTEYPRYQEDAREVIQAFSDMIHSPSNPNLAQVMLLDTAYILFRFIESLCTPRVEEYIPIAIGAALERIWLECDRERTGFMAPNRRGFTRQFSAYMFNRTCYIRKQLTTQSGRDAFAQAILVNSNIVGLAGRVLLMMTMDNTEPEMWGNMLSGLGDLDELVTMMLSAGAVHLAPTAVIEWKKVWKQLHDFCNGSAPTKVPLDFIRQAITAWEPMGPSMEDTEICSHPRCPTVVVEAKPMDVSFFQMSNEALETGNG
ncbi:hypothetical protein FRC07_002706 [Ceratobasidium sp. 392]|nr:hypothetical protein FRC07_002706 [Ceratobasidium sp. 392]